MRRTFLRALVLLVLSVAVGLAVNAFSPPLRRLPYWRPPQRPLGPGEVVGLAEAEALWRAGTAVFLDAREPADYAAGHIALAHNLPAAMFDAHYPAVAGLLSPDQPVVVYCDGEDCDLSHRVMEQLQQVGVPDVRVLLNGWTSWRKAGLPVSTGDQP